MKKMAAQAVLNFSEDRALEKVIEGEEIARNYMQGRSAYDVENVAEKIERMSLYLQETTKRGQELSNEKYESWRQQQKSRAARLEKQLKARWELEELLEEQLNRFRAHYNWNLIPARLKDVTRLLVPKCAPPHKLSSVYWLGDWRPSSILDLLRMLAASSLLSLSSTEMLSQLIHEIRIEEAIIDEEMAEIQATCILHLPFCPMKRRTGSAVKESIQSEFKKIERVLTKAQHLRFKALEVAVRKVLNQTNAAEFLVAFEGIQEVIHQLASHQKLKKGPVMVPVKALESP